MRKIVCSALAGLTLAALALAPVGDAVAGSRHRHRHGSGTQGSSSGYPYPDSTLVTGISWDKSTYKNAGDGGDIWATTSAPGGAVYTAWGDGAIGCRDKVSYGVAQVTGGPSTNLHAVGCGPAGIGKGKIGSLLAVGSTLYAVANLQDRPWPGNSIAIWRSTDGGRSWQRSSWSFSGGDLRPTSFLNFGPGNTGARDGYVYLTAIQPNGSPKAFYLLRAPTGSLGSKGAYQYFSGSANAPSWSSSSSAAVPIFRDGQGTNGPSIVYDAGLHRYILTVAHGDNVGHLGVFEASEPWGAWSTIAYEDRWLGLGSGQYLGARLPSAWMSNGGKTVWAVFSCYNCPQPYHDHYNLIRGTLQVAGQGG